MSTPDCILRRRGPLVTIEVYGAFTADIEAAQLAWAEANRLAVEVVVFLHALPASRHWVTLLRSFDLAKLHRVVLMGQPIPEDPTAATGPLGKCTVDLMLAGSLETSVVEYLAGIGLLSDAHCARLWVKQESVSPFAWDAFPAMPLWGLVVIIATQPSDAWLNSLNGFLQCATTAELSTIEIIDRPGPSPAVFGSLHVILRPARDAALPLIILGSKAEAAEMHRYAFRSVPSAMAAIQELLAADTDFEPPEDTPLPMDSVCL